MIYVKNTASASTDTGLSSFWGNCPIARIHEDFGAGYYWRDDFTNFGIGATDKLGQYLYYIDTSNTVTQIATEVGGVVRLETDATDADGPVLTTGGGTAGAFKIVSGGKDLWFEARIRTSSAALTEHAAFVGLTEEARAVDTGVMTDTPDTSIDNMLADIDAIGFGHFTNAAPQWAFFYQISGQSAQVKVAAAQVITLATWYKLGFWFNASADTIYAYVDGAIVGSFDVSAAGTTTFPSGEELAMTIASKNGTTAAKKLDIDWWACYQLR